MDVSWENMEVHNFTGYEYDAEETDGVKVAELVHILAGWNFAHAE